MSYIPSINIEHNTADQFKYIVTENAKLVLGWLVNGYNSGNHSFTIIGTYGTGKSSFIVTLENDLKKGTNILVKNPKVWGDIQGVEFLNIVGDYTSLANLITEKISTEQTNAIDRLNEFYQGIKKQNKLLFIVIDEFGKVLEHAANNNPEKELYFLQKLAEYVNTPNRRIILLTTLHQNFGSYANKLTEQQRNEWLKVKGRFKEIVFAEPVEQLLYLTARQLDVQRAGAQNLTSLFELAKHSKVISDSFSYETAERLAPLDPISASCLTLAVQRYGQNERSLFSFLTAQGEDSISAFHGSPTQTYNVAKVFDYLKYHFYSALVETNTDSMGWRALNVAIERVENSTLPAPEITEALALIKTIGLLNIFYNGISLDLDFLSTYGSYALGIKDPKKVIDDLTTVKIIRYASYKAQYILFEGTNLDIESEIYKAAAVVPTPTLTVEEIAPYVQQKVVIASAHYYRTGTPRYFEFIVSNEPLNGEPIVGDIDGIINLVFPLSDTLEQVREVSKIEKNRACIYAYFTRTDEIIRHLHEIKKLQYVIDNVAFDDHIAKAELTNQKAYETLKLNEAINVNLASTKEAILWVNDGQVIPVESTRQFNMLLSSVCDRVYDKSPIIRNELINRQKLSSPISLARVNLLDALLEHADEADLGFAAETFPPEKTIYYTLLRNSGIHRRDSDGNFILGAPQSTELQSLWEVCTEFVQSSIDKPRKLSDLADLLRKSPYKLKQGVIDFWIPIFIFINQQDFALYENGTFVLSITKEVFELIQKRLSDFTIRAFKVSGVKLEFFRKYRQFLNKSDVHSVTSSSFLETVKPFFQFYRTLNKYAQQTTKFDNPTTAKFRDVLAKAKDPSTTFFEDLPAALGYSDLNSDEFVNQYIALIRTAVRDLNSCYDLFIDRIERKLVEHFGLPSTFEAYKATIEKRYSSIDAGILTPKNKAFLERLLSPAATRREFFEKLAIVITDKRLDETRDSEEPMLINNMIHMFSALERYSAIAECSDTEEDDEAFNIELASSKGTFAKSQTFRLPRNKTNQAQQLKEQISRLLSDDAELDICVLLKLLNERIK
jgi:hypothetical protein